MNLGASAVFSLLLASIIPMAFCQSPPTAAPDKSQVPTQGNPDGGIVYSNGLGIGIGAPKNWIFDSTSGQSQGLYAVMYPNGSTWSNSTQVIYVNFATLDPKQTLDSFIESDINRFKEASSSLVVKKDDDITIKSKETANVRLFFGDKWGNQEAIAYLLIGHNVAMYVLSCKKSSEFQTSYPLFRSVVSESFSMVVNVSPNSQKN